LEEAWCDLGARCYSGRGVERDLAAAAQLYRRAAERGRDVQVDPRSDPRGVTTGLTALGASALKLTRFEMPSSCTSNFNLRRYGEAMRRARSGSATTISMVREWNGTTCWFWGLSLSLATSCAVFVTLFTHGG
jgi:hypothetical protein